MNRRAFLASIAALVVPVVAKPKPRWEGYRQIGTVTGRWCSSTPNCSNIPRSPLVHADYAEIEARVLARDGSRCWAREREYDLAKYGNFAERYGSRLT